MQPIRVLLVDDHALFREGLALILNAQPDFEVVGEAAEGRAAVAQACELHPDLILMDISMPGGDGVEATRSIKRRLPSMMVVMVTGQRDQEKVVEALLAGAQGYLLKSMRAAELLDLLRSALRGDASLPSLLGEQTLHAYRHQQGAASPAAERLATLSPREQQIVRLVGTDASDKEIARLLQISLHTVKTHMRNILVKLQVDSRRDVARLARQPGQRNDEN